MLWSREQRAFAVESFFSNGRSLVATQRAFRARFEIPPHRLVPGRNSILSWVNSFRECGSVAKPRNGLQRTIRTQENIERVRQSVVRSPRRSVRKHAAAMGISDTTVRRILHEDLQFHPYKGANRPVPSKIKKNSESQKLKKVLEKTINESAEKELRSKALGGNASLSSRRSVNSQKELSSKRK